MGSRKKRGEQLALLDADGKIVPKPKKPRRRRRGVAWGRPPRAERRGFVPHARRNEHDQQHLVHVSMRRVRLAPSLRSERIFLAIVQQLARLKRQGGRVVHYSVQHDHLHLIAEGKDRRDISNQMRKLFSRIALAVNSILSRRGSLFRDRHHRHELKGPTEMRNALAYVLFNDRKHHAQNGGNISEELLSSLDDRSSAAWLDPDDWVERGRPPPDMLQQLRTRSLDRATGEPPVSTPHTWLGKSGWFERGGGRMSLHELPRFL